MLEQSRAPVVLEIQPKKKKENIPAAMRGHADSVQKKRLILLPLSVKSCRSLTHGYDTLQPLHIGPTQHLLSNAYFTHMAALWICGPGFMMRGGGAAINESLQDKYTLLLAWEEVGTVGVLWNACEKKKKERGHLRVTRQKTQQIGS